MTNFAGKSANEPLREVTPSESAVQAQGNGMESVAKGCHGSLADAAFPAPELQEPSPHDVHARSRHPFRVDV